MAYMPVLNEGPTQRSVTDTFLGYNHNLKIQDGEFYDTQNLTTQYYPLLASRKKRGLVKHFEAYQGITQLNGKLAYVDNGILYFDDQATPVRSLSPGMKQLVTMGAYICVFPDHMYYNTVDELDYGSMIHEMTADNVTLTFNMCNSEGVIYDDSIITSSSTAPVNPDDGDLWIDTANKTLNMWSASKSMWVGVTQVFTRITFPELGIGDRPSDMFKEYDGVMIEGLEHEGLDGSKILYEVGTNFIVVTGIISESFTETGVNFLMKTWVPDMDYVIECQNRLWGCYYGNNGTGVVNEIYACVLGDFKNWNRFLGISTDSYVASVGTDGPWTGGVCDPNGNPIFFKENWAHRVTVSATGAHRIDAMPCRGVQPGSGKSVVLLNGYIFYKGAENVFSFYGNTPSAISKQLGDVKYYEAVAGGIEDLYYISMRNAAGEYSLFAADVSKGLWMREDNLQILDFVRAHDELYAVTAAGNLLSMRGSDGASEESIEWYAESGILYYEYPDKKYISRFNIRMQMEPGAKLFVYIEYDSSGIWMEFPAIFFSGTGTVNIPIRPMRCDHLKIKLAGKGEAKIFSLARILEVSTDI